MKAIKITKAGYIYIFITICFGFAAINTGNNLVYLITASLLGFMGVSGFFGRKNIYNLKIELLFPNEVFANREFPLKVTLLNNRIFLPAFLIQVDINGFKILFPFTEEKKYEERFVTYKFYERGLNKIDKVTISSPFPFNFFIRFNVIKLKEKKIVFPEPLQYSFDFLQIEKTNLQGKNFSTLKGFSGDLISIRDYSENDSMKLIHWKSTAKTGKLMVKELTQETDTPVIIDFDNIHYPDLEMKLSFITYFILQNFQMGKKLLLKTENKIITDRKRILETLALK